MSTRIDAVQAYAAAQSDPTDDTKAALRAVLSDGVTNTTPFGQSSGIDALLESLANPMLAPLFASATWSDPVEDGDTVALTATMAPGSMIGGVEYDFTFDDASIAEIKQRLLAAPPPPATALDLSGDMAAVIEGAPMNGLPMLAAYVDASGQPRLSYRGTVQVLGTDQLAMWARDPEGGLTRALPNNPHVTLFYSDRPNRTSYQFFGRASVADDDTTRDTVYDRSPEHERNFDMDRRGVAIVIDVDRVEGMAQGARVVMERGAGTAAS